MVGRNTPFDVIDTGGHLQYLTEYCISGTILLGLELRVPPDLTDLESPIDPFPATFSPGIDNEARSAPGPPFTMLDAFEIINTSGVVLWSRSYTSVSPSVVNHFISDVFIEEKSSVAGAKNGASAAVNPPYKHDQHSLRWTFSKELGIIFVVSTRLGNWR